MAINIFKLHMLLPEREIIWHQQVSSTMHEASLMARSDCAHGAIVGAEEQTQGQGRMGRHWVSPEGKGLYVTFVLRPKLDPKDAPMVTICLGLAVAEAIARVADLRCDLRWPNDILVEDRKLAGILVKFEEGAFLAGIGINVGQVEFPQGLATPATSLALEGCGRVPREELLAEMAGVIDSYLQMLEMGGKASLIETFGRVSTYATGRRVEVDFGEKREVGVTDGLNEDGYLWLRLDDGQRRLIVAGGVRPLSLSS